MIPHVIHHHHHHHHHHQNPTYRNLQLFCKFYEYYRRFVLYNLCSATARIEKINFEETGLPTQQQTGLPTQQQTGVPTQCPIEMQKHECK
jgi:hypothetical protein